MVQTDEGGKVAFTPEKDATYRLSFNYTAKGTTSIRVRWLKDNSNGGYTSADGLIGNIAIRGGGGGNAFSINWYKFFSPC